MRGARKRLSKFGFEWRGTLLPWVPRPRAPRLCWPPADARSGGWAGGGAGSGAGSGEASGEAGGGQHSQGLRPSIVVARFGVVKGAYSLKKR